MNRALGVQPVKPTHLYRLQRVRHLLPWLQLVALLVAAVWGLGSGSVEIGWRQQLEQLLPWSVDGDASQVATILLQVRLPRICLALLIGAALGVTGAAMQGLFRNPLADPSLLGVSAGASLGAGIAIVLTHHLLLPQGFATALQIVLAFLLALATVAMIYAIAKNSDDGGGRSVVTMLLAGIAITALVGAATSLLKYLADETRLRQISLWQMGSLEGRGWDAVLFALVICGLGVWLLCRQWRAFNAVLLGEEEAALLGVDVARLKLLVVGLVAMTMAAAVAVTGVIGFIGLLAPHCVRLLVGPNHRFLLPNSALAGALMLLLADILARQLMPPLVIPVGVITALVGAPLFLWLLVTARGGYRWQI
ncbi:iron ABC transporter permease [Halioxenophilus sp. WMMB6]|uniref:FecCD family ABC transporter permease n=1 Tax=Halioxenophilus sp. WMMB6 TaxID=3073815 RepID=UPI00295E9A4B|nr:iron ABC transporter permease [Halioxenophilus sp. WMMB6]